MIVIFIFCFFLYVVICRLLYLLLLFFFFFKQKTAYEMRISDWSSDVCSSDLYGRFHRFSFGVRPSWSSARCVARAAVHPAPQDRRHAGEPDADRQSVV